MNKSVLLLFFKKEVLLFACLGFLVAATGDPVIAKRGEDRITVSQARALIATADHQTQHRLGTDHAALTDFLRDALLQRAILQLARAEKWDQRPDVAALLQRTHDQVLAQSFVAGHAPLPANYPSDADIKAAYTANLSRFMQPRAYHLAQIFMPGAALKGADDGLRRLQDARAHSQRDGIDMQSAAKSLAGAQYQDLGWVPETQLVPAVKAAVAGLPEGATADPVCMENGCHLIRLIATRAAAPAPLADMRDELIRALRAQKARQEATQYASGLLSREPVSINEAQVSRMTQ